MKNILIIAYYYPPKGGIGVQRTVKHAKYLYRLGYNVHILTVLEDNTGTPDHSLDTDICDGIKVYRSRIHEGHMVERVMSIVGRNRITESEKEIKDVQTAAGKKLKSKIMDIGKRMFLTFCSLIYIPDAQRGWIKYAVREAARIIRGNNIEVIYTTSSPYTSHLIGFRLSKRFNIKWIADFRDPWVSNSFAEYNTITKRMNSSLEKKVINFADTVVSVSKPIVEDFRMRYPEQRKDKFVMITNGYDEEDFEHLDLNISDGNSKFTILYNGTLYGKESPEIFFTAVERLIADGRIDRDNIRIKFIGDMGSRQKSVFSGYKNSFPEVFERSEYMSHGESLMELCKANALLLIIGDFPGSERIYTGKLFEYIRCGKPILSMVPDGAARDLIVETNTGFVSYPSNQDEIEDMIYKSYTDFFNNNKINPNWDKISEYSRDNLVKKLDRIIQELK